LKRQKNVLKNSLLSRYIYNQGIFFCQAAWGDFPHPLRPKKTFLSLPAFDLHLEGVKRYVQVVEKLQDQQPGISFSHKEWYMYETDCRAARKEKTLKTKIVGLKIEHPVGS